MAWLAKSSGEEGNLFLCALGLRQLSRRTGRRRRLLLLLALSGIGHQANIHAAILGAPGSRLVGGHRFVLAQADQVNLVGRNVVLGGKVLDDRVSAAIAQAVVVLLAADSVRTAFHGNDVALGLGNLGAQFIQGGFRLLGQIIFVEGKVYRCLNHGMVVVQVGDRVGQRSNPIAGGSGRLLRLVGGLAGGLGLLLDFRRLVVHSQNALLRARINVLDVAAVLGREVIEFVDLVGGGGNFVADVLLAGAADAQKQTGRH